MMKELESVMNKDVLTVTGETLGQILERTSQGDREVIKSMDDPVSRAGALWQSGAPGSPGKDIGSSHGSAAF